MQAARFSVDVDGMDVPAVLTTPAQPRAALLLVPGSMNVDVEGNFAPMFPGQVQVNTWVYKQLAEQLTARGLAVLRFSKTGPGTGCITRDEARVKAHYGEFPHRVSVAVQFLDELQRRAPGLPVVTAGHSEGAVVVTQLARRREDLQGIILLSGPAKPLLALMIWQQYETQQRTEGPDAARTAEYEQALAWSRDYAAGRPVPEDRSANRFGQMFTFFQSPQAVRYLRGVEQVDPAAELAAVRQPVLIVQGGRDESVHEPNAALLHAAQPRAEVVRFPELQHFYKRVPPGLTAMESFQVSTECDPAVAAAVAGWVIRSTGS
ncbi:MAG: alpha/beta hydrolase [Terriglobales bacterium]